MISMSSSIPLGRWPSAAAAPIGGRVVSAVCSCADPAAAIHAAQQAANAQKAVEDAQNSLWLGAIVAGDTALRALRKAEELEEELETAAPDSA